MTTTESPPSRRWLRAAQRIALRVVVVIALFLVAGAIATTVWLRRGIPALRGRLALTTAPVNATRIERDERGIPTLVAKNEADAFYALGVAHAQDRLGQMELSRRFAQGRLAEILGPDVVEIDVEMRKLGLYRAADRARAHASPRALAILEAYAAGVNAYAQRPGAVRPLELDLAALVGASQPIAEWTVVDSLSMLKLMALQLGADRRDELLYADLVDKVGVAHEREIDDDHPEEGPSQIEGPSLPNPTPPIIEHTRGPSPPSLRGVLAQLLPFPAGIVGSNSWVVSGAHTKSGKPILSNDPHLGVDNPSPWYAVRIDAPGLSFTGYSLPGLPIPVVGRTAKIAWGITAMNGDAQDLFIEKLVDPTHYATPAGPKAFELRDEVIHVAHRADRAVQVRASRHGPIVEDDWKGHGPLALRWTALDDDDVSFDCLLDASTATDFAGFRAGASRCVAPAVNLTYADVDGHIGYVAAGRLPLRARPRGDGPQPGWTDDDEWVGWLADADRPYALDPPSGIIVSANNRVVPVSDPRFIGKSFGIPLRAARIRDLIVDRRDLDLDAMTAMHADVWSGNAKRLVPLLLAAHPHHARAPDVMKMLSTWDLRMTRDSGAGMFFQRWAVKVGVRLYEDQLELVTREILVQEDGVRLLHALQDPTAFFCDDVKTPAHETCAEQIDAAFDDAIVELVAKQGEPSTWRLDRELQVRFASQIGGGVPLLGALFSRTVPTMGDSSTVHVAHANRALHVTVTSTFFADYDLASGETRITSTMGASEHPLSPHFADQLTDWAAVRPRPIGPAVDVLELVRP